MRRATIGWVAILLTFACSTGCGRSRSVRVEPRDAADGVPVPEQSLGQAGSTEESETAFFPADSGGKLLAERLPPSEAVPGLASEKTTPRVRFATPPALSGMSVRLS